MKLLSRVQLLGTQWSVAYQAPKSMGFSRQEYWSGLPFPSPGDLPDPGIKPGSPALQTDALRSEPPGKPSNTMDCYKKCHSPWPSNLLPSLQPKYMAPLNSPHKSKRVPEKHLFLLYWRCQSLWLCVDLNKLWKILKEMGIPDHLTCLLRNLYTGQEATVKLNMEQQTGSKSERSTSRLCIVTLLI